MKAKKCWILGAVAVLIMGGAVMVARDLSPEERRRKRRPLEGLKEVGLLVEHLKPEVGKYGLRQRDLRTQMELQLRRNGIKVTDALSGGYLYLNVNVVLEEEQMIRAANVSIEYQEPVMLVRNPNIRCNAVTWDSSNTHLGSIQGLAQIVAESVASLVDEFSNDYLAANPKTKDKQKQ